MRNSYFLRNSSNKESVYFRLPNKIGINLFTSRSIPFPFNRVSLYRILRTLAIKFSSFTVRLVITFSLQYFAHKMWERITFLKSLKHYVSWNWKEKRFSRCNISAAVSFISIHSTELSLYVHIVFNHLQATHFTSMLCDYTQIITITL